MIGIIVTGLSLLILVVTLYEAAIHIGADFPCISSLATQPEFNTDTQIAYCISHWPRQPSFGGDIYAVGSSNQDTIAINRPEILPSTLILNRQGRTLVVNDQVLQAGEKYSSLDWRLSFNPWVIQTAQVIITNEGMARTRNGDPTEAIFAAGDVYDGWLPSPIGMSILGLGLWLVWQGRRERRHARQNHR